MGILTNIEIAPQFIAEKIGLLPSLNLAPRTAWSWTWVLGRAGVYKGNEQIMHLFNFDRFSEDDPLTALDTNVATEYIIRSSNDYEIMVSFDDTAIRASVAILNAAMLRRYLKDPTEEYVQSVKNFFGLTPGMELPDSTVGILMSYEEILGFLDGENIMHQDHVTDSDRRLWHGISVASRLKPGVFIPKYEF